MRCRPARVTDQKNAVVNATRVGVGKIGIAAFNAAGDILRHEKIEDAVDRVGRDAPAKQFADGLGDVIGARRLVERRKRLKDRRAEIGPMLARRDDSSMCRLKKRIASMLNVIMSPARHAGNMAVDTANLKPAKMNPDRYNVTWTEPMGAAREVWQS